MKILPFLLLLVFFVCFMGCWKDDLKNKKQEYPKDYYKIMEDYCEDASIGKCEKVIDRAGCKEIFLIMDTAYIKSEEEYNYLYFVKKIGEDSTKVLDTANVLSHFKKEYNLDCSVSAVGPFDVNLFIDISHSMAGYVRENAAFQTAIFSMLTGINHPKAGTFKNVSINYIPNDTNIFYVDSFSVMDANYNSNNAKISNFKDIKLSETFFKQECIRNKDKKDLCKDTQIEAIINSTLAVQDDEKISILISDFILSPQRRDNIIESFKQQKIALAAKFREINSHVAIYRFTSKFKGCYYDLNDRRRDGSGKLNSGRCDKEINRPYFMWLFGTKPQLEHIVKIVDKIEPNEKIFVSYDSTTHNFNIEEKGYSTDNDSEDNFYKSNDWHNKTLGIKYLVEGVKEAYVEEVSKSMESSKSEEYYEKNR